MDDSILVAVVHVLTVGTRVTERLRTTTRVNIASVIKSEKKFKSGFTCNSQPFKAASGTEANISQPGSLSLQPVLEIEPGPPIWFANALTVRPWRRSEVALTVATNLHRDS